MRYITLVLACIVGLLIIGLTGTHHQEVLGAMMLIPMWSPMRFFVQSPDGLLHSAEVDAAIAAMQEAETEEDAAMVFIQGVPAMITTAVAAAQANGASAAELAPLTSLASELRTKTDALKAALAPPA
jgi:hypothetical protein